MKFYQNILNAYIRYTPGVYHRLRSITIPSLEPTESPCVQQKLINKHLLLLWSIHLNIVHCSKYHPLTITVTLKCAKIVTIAKLYVSTRYVQVFIDMNYHQPSVAYLFASQYRFHTKRQ